MVELSDETLMAYADGELDPATAARVEAAFADHPAARDRVARFRISAHLAREAFGGPLHEDVPERLLRAAGALGTPADQVTPLAAARRQRPAWSLRRAALPLAASLALVVGLAAGLQLDSFTGAGPAPTAWPGATGQVAAGSALHRALETAESRGSVTWTDEARGAAGQIRPQLTFRAQDGRYCREFELTTRAGAAREAATGVACRSQGGWRTEILVATPVPEGTGGDTYQPASGGGVAALDRYLDAVMGDPALDAAAEAALLRSGWE